MEKSRIAVLLNLQGQVIVKRAELAKLDSEIHNLKNEQLTQN